MTLDALDLAFITRWETLGDRPAPPAAAVTTESLPSTGRLGSPPAAVDDMLVARLLEVARPQWESLADEVEAARLAGHRVIAVTGREPGEGRSTLVACLESTLHDRRRDVTTHWAAGIPAPSDGHTVMGHDRLIVLVDAGVWFPPGPIHRQRLLVKSVGCDAAIIVRRADRPAAPAHALALAAIGVTPLGEVVTFAAGGGREPGRPEGFA